MLSMELPFYIQPKPRGNTNRNGHIYHSTKPYKLFNKRIYEYLDEHRLIPYPEEMFKPPFFIGFFYGFMDGGQDPDLDNLVGAIMDSLQKAKVIKNDNRRYWAGDHKLSHPLPMNQSFFYLGSMRERGIITKLVEERYIEALSKYPVPGNYYV